MHIAEHDSGGANPKVLHEWEHVATMFRQAREIGRILGFGRRQQALMKTIIAHHDLVLDAQIPPANDLNALVVRNRGVEQGVLNRYEKGSEGKSADALKEAMEAENKQARIAGKSDVFTQQEIATAVWAIHATCPEPSFDRPFADFKSEDGTIDYYKIARQQNPSLAELLDDLARSDPPITAGLLYSQIYLERPLERNQKLPLEVFAIANADIEGSSLAKTPDASFHVGDRECLELHHNWRDPGTLHRLMHGDAPEDVRDRNLVLNDPGHQPNRGALAWLDLQVGFAMWQALRAEKEHYLLCMEGDNVNRISPGQAAALRRDFSHAVSNIRATLARAKRVRKAIAGLGEKEKFQYVAGEMHFSEGLLQGDAPRHGCAGDLPAGLNVKAALRKNEGHYKAVARTRSYKCPNMRRRMTSTNAETAGTIDSSEIWQTMRRLCHQADIELGVLIARHRSSVQLARRVTVEAARLVRNVRRGGAAGYFL